MTDNKDKSLNLKNQQQKPPESPKPPKPIVTSLQTSMELKIDAETKNNTKLKDNEN